jgi:DNA-binding SARP family transcriptional activator
MHQLTVSLLGSVQVCHEPQDRKSAPHGLPAPALRPTRKVARLLAYLLLSGRRSHQRDELADCFWGEQGIHNARRCLSTAVWRLRRILEPEGTVHGTYLRCAGGEDIAFNWDSDHFVDALAFDRSMDMALRGAPDQMSLAAARSLEEGLEIYGGELLCGVYDPWALRERERLRARYLDGLTQLMRFCRHVGDLHRGIEIGERILEKDPLREDVHRDLMRLHAGSGQRSQAIRQYQLCRELLARELRVEPLEETQALYHEISAGGCRPGTAPADRQVSAQEALVQLRSALDGLERARVQVEKCLPVLEGQQRPGGEGKALRRSN